MAPGATAAPLITTPTTCCHVVCVDLISSGDLTGFCDVLFLSTFFARQKCRKSFGFYAVICLENAKRFMFWLIVFERISKFKFSFTLPDLRVYFT